MKPEEKIAELFLVRRFGIAPVYEPLGRSRPPDFSIDGTAFEVRRLNQQFSAKDGVSEGLEEVSFPLEGAVRSELDQIPFSSEVGSLFYILSYERPLFSSVSKIAKEIARRAHASYLAGLKETIRVETVTLELISAKNSHEKAFLSGMISDWDSAGWVGEIYVKGIELALHEKASKTRHITHSFGSWILVPVDSIIPETNWLADIGLPKFDLQHFSSVVVLAPDGSVSFEWPSDSLSHTSLS